MARGGNCSCPTRLTSGSKLMWRRLRNHPTRGPHACPSPPFSLRLSPRLAVRDPALGTNPVLSRLREPMFRPMSRTEEVVPCLQRLLDSRPFISSGFGNLQNEAKRGGVALEEHSADSSLTLPHTQNIEMSSQRGAEALPSIVPLEDLLVLRKRYGIRRTPRQGF